MNRIGVIGYGSMGNMLVNGFLETKMFRPDELIISNRSISKLEAAANQWDGISITGDNQEVARESDIVFVCTEPLDVLPVLKQIQSDLRPLTHLISIAACVTINDIERWFSGPVTKVVPSLTSVVKEGVSLICHNAKVSNEQKENIENILGKISKVIRIKETDFEAASDLTSCAPGLFAAICEHFVQAGIRHSEISPEDAYQMVVLTLYGTAKLIKEKQIGFSEMIHRVATKGGITEEGVKVLNDKLPSVFDEVFHKTLTKHDVVKNMIKQENGVIKNP